MTLKALYMEHTPKIPCFLMVLLLLFPLFGVKGQVLAPTGTMALIGAKIYTDPFGEPLPDGVVLIRQGKIWKVGALGKIKIPEDAEVLDCTDLVIMAGFWNSHVHFMEPIWQGAESLPAQRLNLQMQAMLTRYGFTHVFDLATLDLGNLSALRKRIENGEVKGPTLLTAGIPFTPLDGSPFYIAPLELPEIGSPQQAGQYVNGQLDAGGDAIKLWSASPNGKRVVPMPVEVIKAATTAAHKRNSPVFAHPTNLIGARAASQGGVDILTHVAADDLTDWGTELLGTMVASGMAVIPTLKLHEWELERAGLPSGEDSPLLKTAIQQLRSFVQAGGEVLFGTDVGYMADYSPQREYILMHRAGMDHLQILASMTTAPAKRFGREKRTGRIAPGLDADLVVLSADPAMDIKNFSQVKYTIHKGKLIYAR